MTVAQKADLLGRARKAMAFLKTGEAIELLSNEEMEALFENMVDEQGAAQMEILAEDIAMGK